MRDRLARAAIMAAFAALYFAAATGVAASAYSQMTWLGGTLIAGYSGITDNCTQAGIQDVARNNVWVTARIRDFNLQNCSEANRTLPSGYIGAKVAGYRDGVFCGESTWYYSNVATSGWTLSATECSNPAGTQAFNTQGYGRLWTGSAYASFLAVTSPSQNY